MHKGRILLGICWTTTARTAALIVLTKLWLNCTSFSPDKKHIPVLNQPKKRVTEIKVQAKVVSNFKTESVIFTDQMAPITAHINVTIFAIIYMLIAGDLRLSGPSPDRRKTCVSWMTAGCVFVRRSPNPALATPSACFQQPTRLTAGR